MSKLCLGKKRKLVQRNTTVQGLVVIGEPSEQARQLLCHLRIMLLPTSLLQRCAMYAKNIADDIPLR